MRARSLEKSSRASTIVHAPAGGCRVDADSRESGHRGGEEAPQRRQRQEEPEGDDAEHRRARLVARARWRWMMIVATSAGAAAKAVMSAQSRSPSGATCSTVASGGTYAIATWRMVVKIAAAQAHGFRVQRRSPRAGARPPPLGTVPAGPDQRATPTSQSCASASVMKA